MNFSGSAALQARSIFALVMRRMRVRYMGSRAGYVWAIVEAMAWVMVLKLAFQHGNARPPVGESFEIFFATGIIIARTWRVTMLAVSNELTRRPRASLPTLHRLDAAYATWVLEAFTGMVVMIVVVGVLHLFGFDGVPGHLFSCLVAYWGMAVFSLASGMTLALLIMLIPALDHFKGIIMMIFFFTSGFSFLVDRMPPNLREYVVWNPVLHCVEWFRTAFYAGYECRSLDLLYLFVCTVVCLLLGLTGERAFRRKAGRQNTAYADGEETV
jgi:capsular polysaccharide transport system permease protein